MKLEAGVFMAILVIFIRVNLIIRISKSLLSLSYRLHEIQFLKQDPFVVAEGFYLLNETFIL